jgi:hypothetical protein
VAAETVHIRWVSALVRGIRHVVEHEQHEILVVELLGDLQRLPIAAVAVGRGAAVVQRHGQRHQVPGADLRGHVVGQVGHGLHAVGEGVGDVADQPVEDRKRAVSAGQHVRAVLLLRPGQRLVGRPAALTDPALAHDDVGEQQVGPLQRLLVAGLPGDPLRLERRRAYGPERGHPAGLQLEQGRREHGVVDQGVVALRSLRRHSCLLPAGGL